MTNNLFVTSAGNEISFRPVSQLLINKVQSGVARPKKPCYTTEIRLPGQKPVIEEVPMKSRDDARTDGERQAWDKYAQDVATYEAELSQRRFEAIIVPALIYKDSDGIGVKLPEDNEWVELQEYLGIVVPSEKFARFAHYVQTEVLITGEDIAGIILEIMKASGVPREAVESAEAAFRHSIRRS